MTLFVIRFPEGKPKALTFSYDDGVKQDVRLVEIFKQHGLVGTFNVNSGLLGIDNRMSAEEIKNLYIPAGQELACHSIHHPFLEKLPDSLAVFETLVDRENLEKLSGEIIQGMAYPYGTYTEDTIRCLKMANIKYCRTVKPTLSFDIPQNWLALDPTCHHNHEQLFPLADKFVNQTPSAREHGWLFYVWGHSYEFRDRDNWDRIEEFAAQVSGKSDVWYATNMQIYRYVQAFRSLEFAANGSLVYNPTACDVWFSAAGKDYHVPAGKTITIE